MGPKGNISIQMQIIIMTLRIVQSYIGINPLFKEKKKTSNLSDEV